MGSCCSKDNVGKVLPPPSSSRASGKATHDETVCSSSGIIETGKAVELKLAVGEPIKSVENNNVLNYAERMDSVGMYSDFWGTSQVTRMATDVSLDIGVAIHARGSAWQSKLLSIEQTKNRYSSRSGILSLEDLEQESAFAKDKEEFNAQALELMKATARVSDGKYPDISSDQAEEFSKNYMKLETDLDRDVQAYFQSIAHQEERVQESESKQDVLAEIEKAPTKGAPLRPQQG